MSGSNGNRIIVKTPVDKVFVCANRRRTGSCQAAAITVGRDITIISIADLLNTGISNEVRDNGGIIFPAQNNLLCISGGITKCDE